MADTDCRKCNAPMPLSLPLECGTFVGRNFTVISYRCANCGHINNLKRRKANKQKTQEPQANG